MKSHTVLNAPADLSGKEFRWEGVLESLQEQRLLLRTSSIESEVLVHDFENLDIPYHAVREKILRSQNVSSAGSKNLTNSRRAVKTQQKATGKTRTTPQNDKP